MARQRLDKRVVQDGLAPTLREATGLIMAGVVLINDRPANKPGTQVRDRDAVRLKTSHRHRNFVSRGGDKLDGALTDLGVMVAGLQCLDVGASTGGFTDCLLRRGAARVIALDVGYGLLADGLRRDARVVVMERTNARTMTAEQLPFRPALQVVDASFISLRTLLPAMTDVAGSQSRIVAMVKPQFELPRDQVPEGGVVKDDSARLRATDAVIAEAERLGWQCTGQADSKVAGPSGNRERFIVLERASQ
ncbi:MAG: TlyA family RNA methyltransferase [Myxococcales bacterium]|nr:TlyA family RNA methyltransferase [Myxococcales bacterium]